MRGRRSLLLSFDKFLVHAHKSGQGRNKGGSRKQSCGRVYRFGVRVAFLLFQHP